LAPHVRIDVLVPAAHRTEVDSQVMHSPSHRNNG
jgi:hypothetical protein